MDLASISFVGLIAVGTVNVISFFAPAMDSRLKFGISVLVAFIAAFIPVEIANVILANAVIAIKAALAASGVYKIAQKAGGQ